MARKSRSDLIGVSENTFTTNNTKQIEAVNHRRYNIDDIDSQFNWISDELNGASYNNDEGVRVTLEQYFDSLNARFGSLAKGSITLGNIGGSSVGSTLSKTGDIETAIVTSTIGAGAVVTVTLKSDSTLPNIDYFIRQNIESLGSLELDNDILPLVFKKISTTQFYIYVEETGNSTQNIKVHLEVVAI